MISRAMLLARAESMSVQYGIGTSPFMGDDDELRYLEHLAHECAHASLLGVSFGPGIAHRIQDNINLLRDEDQGANEVLAWQVELIVLENLGTPFPEAEAWRQAKLQDHVTQGLIDSLKATSGTLVTDSARHVLSVITNDDKWLGTPLWVPCAQKENHE